MKRTLKRVLLGLAAVIGLLVLSVVYGFVRTSGIRDGQVIDDFVHVIKDGFVSIGVVDVGNGKVVLIDGGNDPAGTALLAGLAKLNVKPENVEAIFLTHGHPDHLAGVHLFPSAKVYAMEADIPLAEGLARSRGLVTRFMPAKPTGIKNLQPLHDTDTLKIENRVFHCFLIPGHTAGSAAYWVDGVLFVGDSADVSHGGALLPAQWLFSDSPLQNRRSLEALGERLEKRPVGVEWIVPSHSGALRDARALDAFAGRETPPPPPNANVARANQRVPMPGEKAPEPPPGKPGEPPKPE